MIKRSFGRMAICTLAAVAFTFLANSSAQAGWFHGSWGGSYGSYGSWGSHGSRGGLLGRIFHRHRWGSHGSWGSSGYASQGSHGSWGSQGYAYYSSHGSWGGSSGGYYSSGGGVSGYSYGDGGGVYVVPGPVYQTPPAGAQPGVSPPAATPGEAANAGDAVLNVLLPSEAKVFVNGKPTQTPGSHRRYVSRNLQLGQTYTYEVRAEIQRDGQTLARTQLVQLAAGSNESVEFDFDQPAELTTTVAIHVPEGAKVQLAGREMNGTGSVRYFSTKSLAEGQSWDAYPITVTLARDGKTLTHERKIDIVAGRTLDVHFELDADNQRLASR